MYPVHLGSFWLRVAMTFSLVTQLQGSLLITLITKTYLKTVNWLMCFTYQFQQELSVQHQPLSTVSNKNKQSSTVIICENIDDKIQFNRDVQLVNYLNCDIFLIWNFIMTHV